MMVLSSLLRESVISATMEVFSTMLDVEVAASCNSGVPPEEVSDDRVVAIVGMTGKLTGSGALISSPSLAAELAGRMLMQEYSLDGLSIHNEVLDAFAEISNMIIGGVKTRLEESYGLLAMSIPTVIYGRNFRIRNPAMESTNVGFDCCNQRLDVCISLIELSASQTGDRQSHSSLISLLPG